ncbi:tetratricopeptide repeat protein [Tenacibaculum sp. AHE15PA]|uniref:tetratricopeptide repeat protein n=1 Tax=unclassified Tenacibaculum TaxID=2635139 RepID=UPI001C4E7519|nr:MULTISPECIES: tetratricopeptide repeat protein [unclassified Tenacibaculum]QXP73544.1 tetratricopeptide repeat protein [Tenacibaculum sp. AHE14PA]QXP75058.1 tetratricopeptide repeat protein [Tenacibaculum sp. AHE15PA]
MKKKILTIVLIISFFKVGAQTSTFITVDSLVHIGRYQKALAQLKKLQESYQSTKRMATIYSSIDNYKEASKYYEKALLLNNEYSVKVALGKSYQKEKKLQKAITVFEEITTTDSDNSLINYQLGKLYLQTKQPKKAKFIFEELIKKDESNANYHYQMAIVYTLFKKRDLKINSFLATYKNDNEHIKAIHQLAVAYTLLRDKDSANLFIDKGLKVNGNHIALNRLKINNLYRNKKYLKAIDLLEKIDSLEPNEHYTKKMLGRSFFKLKDYEKARNNFKKALKIDRADFKSYTYLGDIDFAEKDYKSARFNYWFATYVGKEARDTEYYQLARAYKELGKPKEEMNAYRDAYEENFKNYRALFQLANTSENFYKDKKIAYKYYKNYLNKFRTSDSLLTSQVKTRLKEIKKFYFLKGELLE